MNVQIEDSWKAHLQPEFDKDYFYTLTNFVREEYGKYAIYPPGKLIFNAFNLCPFDKVKVVIIGQDPYHGPGQAHGLCFSVNDGVPFPPSLVNIFKEIKADIGTDAPPTGNLTVGRNKAYYCSMPLSPYVPIKPAPIRTAAGKHLQMPPSVFLPKNGSIWSLYYGELMHNEKVLL